MGNRFEILVETEGELNLFHCQNLWGEYAIRRLGSFVYAYQHVSQKKGAYVNVKTMKNSLYWGFIHDLDDWNIIIEGYPNMMSPDIPCYLSKKFLSQYNNIKAFLDCLFNNDGYFLLKIERGEIEGYGFYNPHNKEIEKEKRLKLISWKDYLINIKYKKEDFNDKQTKELERGKEIFSKIPLLKNFPKIN